MARLTLMFMIVPTLLYSQVNNHDGSRDYYLKSITRVTQIDSPCWQSYQHKFLKILGSRGRYICLSSDTAYWTLTQLPDSKRKMTFGKWEGRVNGVIAITSDSVLLYYRLVNYNDKVCFYPLENSRSPFLNVDFGLIELERQYAKNLPKDECKIPKKIQELAFKREVEKKRKQKRRLTGAL